jgi:hypothetical protein
MLDREVAILLVVLLLFDDVPAHRINVGCRNGERSVASLPSKIREGVFLCLDPLG